MDTIMRVTKLRKLTFGVEVTASNNNAHTPVRIKFVVKTAFEIEQYPIGKEFKLNVEALK